MRVGIAGVGRIGTMHATLLAQHSQVRELIICDPAPGRAALVANQIGGRSADTVESFLESDLDAVVIATSTASHADLVEAFCERGIPVFCEKPVAMDLQRTSSVARTQSKTGNLVHVGFQRRFDPGYVELRRQVRAGSLGGIRRMHLVSADRSPPPAAFIGTSGGIFRDLLIHDFDLLRWVSGQEVTSVWATGSNRGATYFGEVGDVDEAIVVATLQDGTIASIHGSRYNGAGYDVRMEVAGTEATSFAGLDNHLPVRSTEPGPAVLSGPARMLFSDRFAAAYTAELTAFLETVVTNGSSLCSVADGYEALLIAEAADLSAHSGRSVSLSDVRPQEAQQ